MSGEFADAAIDRMEKELAVLRGVEVLLGEADNVPAVAEPLTAAAGKPIVQTVFLRLCCRCQVILGVKDARTGEPVSVADIEGRFYGGASHTACEPCRQILSAEGKI